MTRREELKEMYDKIFFAMTDLASYSKQLVQIGCKREADMLDTVTGKLFVITKRIDDKKKQ